MIRAVRILGFTLIAAGAIVLASWLIEPLRAVWPLFFELPLPVQIGLGAAAAGLLLLLGSVIWERLEDRSREAGMLDD